ncbi:MAG: exonuclease [Candidatus Pacebacteria bacterium]|nr:exonuclease [Candidatus Paceibacterota bacterium]MDD5620979.1 exonuclease [Candidatus Paceibacterota bacterium]
MKTDIKNLIFVDCKADGKSPSTGILTEFGAVAYPSRATFHGILVDEEGKGTDEKEFFENFEKWILQVTDNQKPTFVSDNPAFDWQWINDGFWKTIGRNPFGHSARRIGDFYAGLKKNFKDASSWKKLRIISHDHNPVHDATGNLEAFERLLKEN